jgi:hypothetical protein
VLHALPAHIILLDLIIVTIFDEEQKLRSSSSCNFLQPHVTSSLLSLNILFGASFSDTLNLCSSLNVRHQVSHPYRADTITVLYILNIYVLDSSSVYLCELFGSVSLLLFNNTAAT